MQFNDLKDYANFFQRDIHDINIEVLYKTYGLYGNVWADGSVICHLHSKDDDLAIFTTNRYCAITIHSLGIDNIDIADPHWLSPEREEELLNYLNYRFASVGEKVLQEL